MEVSADALLHCFAVDEEVNGEAVHMFQSLKNAVGTSTQGQYQDFDESQRELTNRFDNKDYR